MVQGAAMRNAVFPDGTGVPALGQGTWRMGERAAAARAEAEALRLGIELGLTLIDTAEMYGEGGAEQVVARAIAGRRDAVFLVSKVYPHNATRAGTIAACERSLRRLNTDRLDLYLLHWRGGVPLEEFVDGAERLKRDGRILRWGVSNFDVDDMEELFALPGGDACATNQVLYNPEARGIEFDLVPWAAARGVPLMAYSPLGQGGRLLAHPALARVASRHGVPPAAVAVAFSLRLPNMISIPKAASEAHLRANAAAAGLTLGADDLAELDAAFPPPRRKHALGMI
jgi:diketogulonate reductase-like aldo/keto reductase